MKTFSLPPNVDPPLWWPDILHSKHKWDVERVNDTIAEIYEDKIKADITDDTSMFIYRRALGTTPESGASHVGAAVVGEEPESLSTLKHFPGHGAAPGDSHRGIPSTTESYDQWLQTVQQLAAELTTAEQTKFFATNAIRDYNLQM